MAPMIAAPIRPPAAGAGSGGTTVAQAGLAATVTKATIATGSTNRHIFFLQIEVRTNREFAKYSLACKIHTRIRKLAISIP